MHTKKEWYIKNKSRLLVKAQQYRSSNKKKRCAYEAVRKLQDPVYRLRTNLSKIVSHALHGNKKGSLLDGFQYSIPELKTHLENQFDSWMNWDNYGRYDSKSWNDSDQTTWTWQIDHIIPQSELPYSSMTDVNFVKCWSLENLRPLAAKTNVINGTKLSKRYKNLLTTCARSARKVQYDIYRT